MLNFIGLIAAAAAGAAQVCFTNVFIGARTDIPFQ
jgi:uncharacterized membrane protein YtjA (UPF0391 family)